MDDHTAPWILMRHRVRLPTWVQTPADLARHFRALSAATVHDPAISGALETAATELDSEQPPGPLAAAFEAMSAREIDPHRVSAFRGVAEAVRRMDTQP